MFYPRWLFGIQERMYDSYDNFAKRTGAQSFTRPGRYIWEEQRPRRSWSALMQWLRTGFHGTTPLVLLAPIICTIVMIPWLLVLLAPLNNP